MISAILSRVVILVFGTLYPAYCSYKAIRTKNVKEYVRWMMHWVVFSCFVAFETFSDVFLSWFPFYYEIKVCIVLWLLSPMTKGSSILYKKFIHPKLSRHEQEIDEYISQAKERGYKAVVDVGTKTFDYASKLIVETAIKATEVITLPPKRTSKDTVDMTDSMTLGYTPETSISSSSTVKVADLEEPIQSDNMEFSDIELDLDIEPVRKRTRSQSRLKETVPMTLDEVPIQKKGRKPAKQTGQQKVRRRRVVVKEESVDLINTDDDEN